MSYGYTTVTLAPQNPWPVPQSVCLLQGTAFAATIACFDDAGEPFTPATLKYQVFAECGGRLLLPWTVVASPGAVNAVTVPAASNCMVNLTRTSEEHTILTSITDENDNTFLANATFSVTRVPAAY